MESCALFVSYHVDMALVISDRSTVVHRYYPKGKLLGNEQLVMSDEWRVINLELAVRQHAVRPNGEPHLGNGLMVTGQWW